jgi:cation diffusion facilitator family transporter
MASHTHDLSIFSHSHAFGDGGAGQRERALTVVTAITLVAMVIELAAGWWTGSLALLADGWHMGTHALALGGAALAYRLSARAAAHSSYAFGGWKIEVLAAYTSGLMLMVAAVWIAFDAVLLLREPRPIAYTEAIAVAVFGLLVNAVCAWRLSRTEPGRAAGAAAKQHDGHGHGHGHDHGHGHGHDHSHAQDHDHAQQAAHGHGHSHGHAHGHGHDHNFSAAYLHVLADALTSVLAIAALAGGLFFGWSWLDPAVALLGAIVIGRWAVGVLRNSAKALVDATADPHIDRRIRDLIEADGDAVVADLHVWQVGAGAWSAVVSIVADAPLAVVDYRARLESLPRLRHLTIEVHRCQGAVDTGWSGASRE